MKSKKPIAVILICLLLLGGGAYYFITHPFPIKPKPEPVVYDYATVVELLQNDNTCQKGLHLLDSLVDQGDYQATFLKSRIYFDSSDPRDTLFFDKDWKMMQKRCNLRPDKGKAHSLLMQAFRLREDDPALLFQMGLDFFSGERRGCDRNFPYAAWCFYTAEYSLRNSTDPVSERYKTEISKRKKATETENITIEKPQ